MNATAIESQFASIGARFKLRLSPERWETNDYAIDIRRDRQGESFELRLGERLRDSFDASILQACHHGAGRLASGRAEQRDRYRDDAQRGVH
jgi:hypothetical protein